MDVVSDPKTFNPALATETTSTQILGYLFRGLTRQSPVDGTIKPDLAKDWTISEGGEKSRLPPPKRASMVGWGSV